MIPESFIQDLLARVAIEDIVGRYVQLRKGGANLLGLCPFHEEKTPSFTVSPSKQFYHCFGCGAHGSAVSFLMAHTGATFPEAIRTLAGEVGLTVPQDARSPRQREADQRRKTERSLHQQALEAAQAHYLKQLKASPQAIAYLRGRGLSGKTAAYYGLGWTGQGRRPLAAVMPDYESAALVESGLVIETEEGRRYDRFRDRIMFPIRNRRGHLIGFGGRLIDKGEPKYLNSPETTLFSKGRELYGLWEGRQAIRQEGHVLVVEGYMDVVALAEQGLGNAVATLGTATTDVHIQSLMRVSDRIVFCFDGDDAGHRAAWKALETCLPLLRDDIAIRFLFLPDQHDPDSYIRAYGVKAFRAHINEARALSHYMLDTLEHRHNMDEPEGRAACVHEAAPLLGQVPKSALRIQLEGDFAQRVRLTPDELAMMLERAAGSQRRTAVQHHRAEPLAPSVDSGTSPAPMASHAASAVPYSHTPPRRRTRQRAVTPMAKRLLRLLLAHPHLADSAGDQQLEILANSPHLVLVRDLITLANVSGARHAGALLQALEPGSDLALVLEPLATELLTEEDLPDPDTEWNDALGRIEREAIKAEQSALVQAGLHDEVSRKRYQQLTRQLAMLNAATTRETQ